MTNEHMCLTQFAKLLCKAPDAYAEIIGSQSHACLSGKIKLYQTRCGALIAAEITGLPSDSQRCSSNIFGFHFHEGEVCSGTKADPFADAKLHFNPERCEHPHHAGDLPPLFGNNGYALSIFLTDRFTVSEVVGKAIIIHSAPDDFATQPGGNSGEKIACGIVKKAY